LKDSALAKKLAAVARKYVDDDDMLEELGSKGQIEKYVWGLISEGDEEVLDIAFDFMKSHLDKEELFQALNTERLAERAKKIRKDRPIY
jgi:hypothetical protein